MTTTEPSLETLRRIVAEHTAVAFVWPGEVVMPDGLDDAEVERRIDAGEVQPLIVDPTTAHMLLTVYAAASDGVQARLEELIPKSRAHFAHAVECGWQCVRPRPRP